MKKEKIFGGFGEKEVPEKEWEANYLNNKRSADIAYMLGFIALGVLFLAVLLFSYTSHPCEAEMEYAANGNLEIKANEIPKLKDFQITWIDGKIKASGSCLAVGAFFSSFE